MYLNELPQVGVQLRLSGGDPDVERAVAADQRQYRVEAKRVGPNLFVTLFTPNTPGRKYFSVPDQLREVKFEWLVVLREEIVSYLSGSGRDAQPARVVLIPHNGGESLRPFGRSKGVASFSGRSLSVERLSWVKPTHGAVGHCLVNLQTLAVSLRPTFRHSREEREECGLPRESPVGFDLKVESIGDDFQLQLNLTREGGVEQMVVPTSRGAFSPVIGWEQLSPVRRAALVKFLCGQVREDYRLDPHERWRRFNDRMGEFQWVIPADTAGWRTANEGKPRWQWGAEPREQRCEAEVGLDGLPVRRAKACGHLHFAEGVDPTHEEPEEDEGYRYDDEDRW